MTAPSAFSRLRRALAATGAAFGLAAAAQAGALNLLTFHNDIARTGTNPLETTLTTANVNPTQFGLITKLPLDGYCFAQPLYVSGQSIAGGTHNVLYVATMEDTVYAYDADTFAVLWKMTFTNPSGGITPVPITDITGDNTLNIHNDVGILSTPVIDLTSNTIYLVTRTKEPGPAYFQRLHALDLSTGAEKFGGPVAISASVSGAGSGSVNGVLKFDPLRENQRPGLALVNNEIIIAWAGHEDLPPYHGWIMAYNAKTLAQVGVFNALPDGNAGGFWMSGQPPAIDASGNIYLITGNGDWDGTRNFGDSFVKLSTANGLTLTDWFTPNGAQDNPTNQNAGDLDLGAGGAMLFPGTNYLLGGGKLGILYVLDSTNLGHIATNNTQIPQQIQATIPQACTFHVHGGPVYWNSAVNGPTMYIWGENGPAHAYRFINGKFQDPPFSISAANAPITGCGMPGAMLSISSNGSATGTGILWANCVYTGDAIHDIVPGILRALDANDLTKEIWNSRMNQGRDDIGFFGKFVPPTVMNGRVYQVTFSNSINVYGLLTAATATPTTARLVNLSARASVGVGAVNALSAGFVVGGAGTSGSKPLLLRGVGPSLTTVGVANPLPHPLLTEQTASGTVLHSNAGWLGDPTVTSVGTQVGAFAFTGPNSGDAALYDAGEGPNPYTISVTDSTGATGVALAEIYDASPSFTPTTPQLINLSARANVGTGSNILVAGFVIGGTGARTVLLRGIGPALGQFGVSGTLPNPVLTLFDANGNRLASNAGWGGTAALTAAFTQVGAFALPANSSDSAILVTLAAGNYTVQVADASGQTGEALVEVYAVP